MIMSRKLSHFSTVEELHAAANRLLSKAITAENARLWNKVVNIYSQLFAIIGKHALPHDYEPPVRYGILMYELHYHMGLALHHLGKYRQAAKHYTKSLHFIALPKNGCIAGCHTNSCLMMPIFARRSFTYAKLGEYDLSLKDAEKAVVMDNTNPDVFASRALAYSTSDQEPTALKDADAALKLDPNHVCSLVLRGSWTRPLAVSEAELRRGVLANWYHRKAAALRPDAKLYLTICSFDSDVAQELFDRFLKSLHIPHTITNINLIPDRPNTQVLERSYAANEYTSASNKPGCMPPRPSTTPQPFKCGTPIISKLRRFSALRRRDYSASIRRKTAKPPDGKDVIDRLMYERPSSSVKPPTSNENQSLSKDSKDERNSPDIRKSNHRSVSAHKSRSSRAHHSHKPKGFGIIRQPLVIPAPKTYTIDVFQPLNIKEAPRMYYRPWNGDRIPVCNPERHKSAPPFY